MRLFSDLYACANPYLEPVSLEVPAASGDADGAHLGDGIVDPAIDLDRHLELVKARAAITSFINTLDACDQALVARVFWHEETQAEAARALKLSDAAVSKRMHRIVQRGRRALARYRRSALFQ